MSMRSWIYGFDSASELVSTGVVLVNMNGPASMGMTPQGSFLFHTFSILRSTQ